jgi:hypothetical protein
MTMTTAFQVPSKDPVKPCKEPLTNPANWLSLRTLTLIASVSALGLVGCAQTPVGATANAAPLSPAPGMPMADSDGTMAKMDAHMKVMREMHDKMMQARSPEERNALMAMHMKQMKDGMAMMGGMGSGGMAGMHGKSPMAEDMAARQQMMEKRMEMMQSMMQMMMDRMPQAPSKQ